MNLRITLPFFLAAASALADGTNNSPPFPEVYQLLATHLQGVSSNDLNRAAVEGLVSQLNSNVMLVAADSDSNTATSPLSAFQIYDDSYAYFRVGKVESPLTTNFMAAYQQLSATNHAKIKGIVLDLRYAAGSDYLEAAAVADCFLDNNQVLLESNGQTARSTKKENAITLPLAVLINGSTSEAAEALAAVLRETSTGLTLGSPTAGRANIFQEFPLSNGDKLRVAVGQIKLADGQIFTGGVKPDIAVDVSPGDERAFWQRPYQTPVPAGSTNQAGTSPANDEPYQRYSEAELVREQREGADLEAEFNGRSANQTDPRVRTIKDPALARALDLLKGLAVVQQGHPG